MTSVPTRVHVLGQLNCNDLPKWRKELDYLLLGQHGEPIDETTNVNPVVSLVTISVARCKGVPSETRQHRLSCVVAVA